MAKLMVAVGNEHTEPPGRCRIYALHELTVLQLAYVLDDLVDELVARDVWTGPRPKLRREPVPSRVIGNGAHYAGLLESLAGEGERQEQQT